MCSPRGFSLVLAYCLNLYQRPFKKAAEIQSDTINRYFAYTWQTCKVRMRMLACQPCEWECCHAKVFLAGPGGVLNQRTNHSTTPQKCSNVSWVFWTPPSHSGSHAQHHTSQVADVYTKSSSAGKSSQYWHTLVPGVSLTWLHGRCWRGLAACHMSLNESSFLCPVHIDQMTNDQTKRFQTFSKLFLHIHQFPHFILGSL